MPEPDKKEVPLVQEEEKEQPRGGGQRYDDDDYDDGANRFGYDLGSQVSSAKPQMMMPQRNKTSAKSNPISVMGGHANVRAD